MILNQKEEVLTVELTQHGRKLIGLGYFYPKYFSFFDDTIIYDSSYINTEEDDINKIQTRILDKSITLTFPNLNNDILRDDLGSSNTMSEYAPAWSLRVLNGEIFYEKERSSYQRKRFTIKDIKYTIEVKDKKELPTIYNDYLLIDISELNVDDDLSNFEVELFTYDETAGGKEVGLERRLRFTQRKSNIIDDIIYDPAELPQNYFETVADENDAAYYFEVLVDEEIDTDFISAKEKTVTDRRAATYQSDYIGPIDPKC